LSTKRRQFDTEYRRRYIVCWVKGFVPLNEKIAVATSKTESASRQLFASRR
jgi:hypothetical protein